MYNSVFKLKKILLELEKHRKSALFANLTIQCSYSFIDRLKLTLVNVSLKFQTLISILCNHREFYNSGCSRMVSDFVQTY